MKIGGMGSIGGKNRGIQVVNIAAITHLKRRSSVNRNRLGNSGSGEVPQLLAVGAKNQQIAMLTHREGKTIIGENGTRNSSQNESGKCKKPAPMKYFHATYIISRLGFI